MKSIFCPKRLAAVAGLSCAGVLALNAADQPPPTYTAPAPAPVPVANKAPASEAGAAPILLPGAAEVLKLSRAKIEDDTIVAFVKSSKTAYNLGANEIVYLREQGVSERVITAMLEQHPHVAATWAASTTTPAASSTPGTPNTPSTAPAATTVVQTAPVYVSPPPAYAYPGPAYGYYDPYPYYLGGYWGFPLPGISLSFGFGHGFHGGGFHGGFHGGHR